jgi:adenine-specific DNA-methyltransferase
MNFRDQETAEKLRGGYYTPPPLAMLLTRWALSAGANRILEPSCGDGAFLRAIEALLDSGQIDSQPTIDAIELIPAEAAKAQQVVARLRARGMHARVEQADFFAWMEKQPARARWDAIIGNPPYIRYQYLHEQQQELAAAVFRRAGVPYTKRTNAWVPFVIAGVTRLSPGGRLGMVLPAELLHIMHADGLRLLLEQEMSYVSILDLRDLVFEGTLQGVLLVRATKRRDRGFQPLTWRPTRAHQPQLPFTDGTAGLVHIHQLKTQEDLSQAAEMASPVSRTRAPLRGRWTRGLLAPHEMELLTYLEMQPWARRFVDLASVDVGIVTGANKFFVVDAMTARTYGLTHIASPMLARSEFIKGIAYNRDDQQHNENAGKAVLFLQFPNIPKHQLPQGTQDYLNFGEEQGLHTRYKCRIRDPWYTVPYVWVSDIALLKRCHHFPRLVLNEAGAYSTDTAYRITMSDQYRGREKDLVFSFLNSLTLLCAELEGRHYGGGVLELVPTEIEHLVLPLVQSTEEQFSTLDRLVRQSASAEQILGYTDPLVLGPGTPANLSPHEILTLREARRRLHDRRLRR